MSEESKETQLTKEPNDNANSFDARLQKAFDFGADSTKQLMTVSVGIIAFTITFSKDFIGDVSFGVKIIAVVAWVFYFVSVFFGLVTLNSLTGQLEPGDEAPSKPSLWATAVNRPMIIQWSTFMLGLVTTIVFGFISIFNQSNPPAEYKFTFPNSTINILTTDSSSNKRTNLSPDTRNKIALDTSLFNSSRQGYSYEYNNSGGISFSFDYGKGNVNYLIPPRDTATFKQQLNSYHQARAENLNKFLAFLTPFKS